MPRKIILAAVAVSAALNHGGLATASATARPEGSARRKPSGTEAPRPAFEGEQK